MSQSIQEQTQYSLPEKEKAILLREADIMYPDTDFRLRPNYNSHVLHFSRIAYRMGASSLQGEVERLREENERLKKVLHEIQELTKHTGQEYYSVIAYQLHSIETACIRAALNK